ncbi:MAG: DNA repair protein RecN [Bacteroidaceae bacterium]|nr:DNA repair protein RecN [Bacteroidaceae bacterium]
MLKSLDINNFALIEHLQVDFSNGFSVITGETGTGKSVLLGAVSMLLGQRSDAKAVREGATRCVIEGCFDLSGFPLRSFYEENDLDYDEECCIVRREVAATGRSRAFINDTPVAVAQLKELGSRLIDIHSQHQNLLLGDRDFQLGVLDTLAAGEVHIEEYTAAYSLYIKHKKELSRLKEEIANNSRDEDFLRFQLDEIQRLSLRDGEQEELEQEQQELSHAEEIQTALCSAANILDGDDSHNLLHSLREAVASLSRVVAHYQGASELAERLETNYIELKDCCAELQQRAERVVFSPDKLEYVDRRLSAIYDLEKKHRVSSVAQLLQLADEWSRRLDNITNADEKVATMEKESKKLYEKVASAASRLTNIRKEAASTLQSKITEILVTLGMPLIRFEVAFEQCSEFTPSGADAVTFLFSANSSTAMQPLADVASGGEMSRVMLALKSLIADNKQQPTLIFDEIDTGISGVLAERMGRLMQQMGTALRQVISITHLPQVAALGTSHYKVYKEEGDKGTRTNIIELKGEERVREIAQMMSGEVLTDAAIDNARTLLAQNKDN